MKSGVTCQPVRQSDPQGRLFQNIFRKVYVLKTCKAFKAANKERQEEKASTPFLSPPYCTSSSYFNYRQQTLRIGSPRAVVVDWSSSSASNLFIGFLQCTMCICAPWTHDRTTKIASSLHIHLCVICRIGLVVPTVHIMLR